MGWGGGEGRGSEGVRRERRVSICAPNIREGGTERQRRSSYSDLRVYMCTLHARVVTKWKLEGKKKKKKERTEGVEGRVVAIKHKYETNCLTHRHTHRLLLSPSGCVLPAPPVLPQSLHVLCSRW